MWVSYRWLPLLGCGVTVGNPQSCHVELVLELNVMGRFLLNYLLVDSKVGVSHISCEKGMLYWLQES